MSPYEAIGKPIKPRLIVLIEYEDGETEEFVYWPWHRFPWRIGSAVKQVIVIWKPP